MNKKIYLLTLLTVALSSPWSLQAQNNKNVGIGTGNPDPSAVLDISSTDKGVLVPRLTSAQIAAINTPAEGLMVYNKDSSCYFYYNNFSWVSLCHTGTASNGAHIAVVNGRTDVQLGGPLTQNTDIPLAGKKLTFSTVGTGGNVGIGTATPDPSAILDLSNTNSTGLLVPKIALTQTTVKAPVTNPAVGLMVFNINAQNDVTPGYYFWDGNVWMRLFSSNLPVVSTVSVTAPIVNTGTAQDPNIGITTGDLKGSSVVVVNNGTNVLAGAAGADVDVAGTSGGLLYGTGTSSGFTPAGTTGQYLQSQGAGIPAWATGSNLTGSSVVTVVNGAGQGVGNGNVGFDVTGPAGAVLYGNGPSSSFTAQGVAGQVLQSNGAGAPTWVNPNAALVASDLLGSSVLSVTNGNGKVVGLGNTNLDVVGTNGGIMYGTGASSAFTAAGTVGQVLRSNGAGAPVWASPNATITTNDVTGSSVVTVTNGTGQVVGGSNMNIDVAGTSGGVLYGTGASAAFSGVGTAGQYLQSNGAGAPTWSTINTTTSNLTGSSVVTITNGTNKVFGAGNAGVDVSGTNGGVLYGTGASSGFTSAGTAGQLLQSNGAGAPTWVNPPVSLAASNGLHVSATPDVQLGGSLTSNTSITQAGFSLSASGGTINLNDASNNTVNIATSTSNGPVNIANGATGGQVQIGKSNTVTVSNAKVGINTPPSQALDVNGNVQFSNALMPAGLPGASGQYLKSSGAGIAPTWATPLSTVTMVLNLNAALYDASLLSPYPTGHAVNIGLGGWSIGNWSTATLMQPRWLQSLGSGTYFASSAVTLYNLRINGSVMNATGTHVGNATVYVMKYSCGAAAQLLNATTQSVAGTLLGSQTVSIANSTTNYLISLNIGNVSLVAGDIVVCWLKNEATTLSVATNTFYFGGKMDFELATQ